MALTKESVIDHITVLEDGQIEVRRADKLKEDGVEIAKAYHRHVVVPGASLVGEDARVRQVGEAVHTTAVVSAYQASLDE